MTSGDTSQSGQNRAKSLSGHNAAPGRAPRQTEPPRVHNLNAAPLTNSAPVLGPLTMIINFVEIVTKFLGTSRKKPVNKNTLKSRDQRAKINERDPLEFVGGLWLSKSEIAEIDFDVKLATPATPMSEEQMGKARIAKIRRIITEWRQRQNNCTSGASIGPFVS